MPGPSLSIRQQCPNASEETDGLMSAEQAAKVQNLPQAGNRVFYVDGVTGNDNFQGTANKPYRTLARALSNFTADWQGLAEIHVIGVNSYDMLGDFYLGKPASPAAKVLRIIGDGSVSATGLAGTFSVTASPDGQHLTANLNAAVGANALEGARIKFLTGANAGSQVLICTNGASGGSNATAMAFGVGATGSVTGDLPNPISIGDTFTITRPASTINIGISMNDGLAISYENVIASGYLNANTVSSPSFTNCDIASGFFCGLFGGPIVSLVSCYINNAFFLHLGMSLSRSKIFQCVMRGTPYLGFIGWGIVVQHSYIVDSNIGGEEAAPTVEIQQNTFAGSPPFGVLLGIGQGSVSFRLDENFFDAVAPYFGNAIDLYGGSFVWGGGNTGSIVGYFIIEYNGVDVYTPFTGHNRIALASNNTVTGAPSVFLVGNVELGYADLPFTGHVQEGSGSAALTAGSNVVSGLTGLSAKNAGDILILSGAGSASGSYKILNVSSATSCTVSGPSIPTGQTQDWKLYSVAQPNNSAILNP